MCGILGLVSSSALSASDRRRFGDALELQVRRGPDDRSTVAISDQALLGHARLSILDIDSRSNQPMRGEKYTLVFNGEVFNFIELRSELEARGYVFRTSGDTEVVVRAFDEWGVDAVKKFNGMWAIGAWCHSSGTLTLSRDRFGIKPLYYSNVGNTFTFSSTIKSILHLDDSPRVPNKNAIASFCKMSIGGETEDSWFEGVHRLPPAHNLVYRDGRAAVTRYWDYPSEGYSGTYHSALQKYKAMFTEAVKLRLRSDVPFGCTLSGGLDSSSILCVSKLDCGEKIDCYSSAFSQNVSVSSAVYKQGEVSIDESEKAKRLAEELDVTFNRVVTDYEGLSSKLNKIINALEQGNSSPAVIPLDQLMNTASSDVKVLLEGQGADELLGGYNLNLLMFSVLDDLRRFRLWSAVESIRVFRQSNRLRYAFAMWVRILAASSPFLLQIKDRLTGLSSIYDEGFKCLGYRKLSSTTASQQRSLVNRELLREHQQGLVNLLSYGDAISMDSSIESRLPFMDYRLVEFVFTLPSSYKFTRGITKRIHRDAMANVVPPEILNDKMKLGYTTPISEIIKTSAVREILFSESIFSRGIFSRRGLHKIYADHIEGRKDHSGLLYRCVLVELWYRVFIDVK